MNFYDKLQRVMEDRNVEGYVGLLHENAEIIFHKSCSRFDKSEWASMVAGMMGNPKFVSDSSRCFYENDEILVAHNFMSYPDDTKEDVMLVCMPKDGQIIRMETGATPLG
ncbi:hypothetical protein N8X78_01520 [Planktomarina temperata]|nr:hypothetical protein [Planktomarina temperata]